jgi:hypothetical protein
VKPPRDKRRPERHDRRRLLREIEEREARRERWWTLDARGVDSENGVGKVSFRQISSD